MTTKELNKRDARFDARITTEQKQLFEMAAQLGGYRNLTDFIVIAVQQKANEIISERERIISSKRDSEIFFDAILNPKSPNEALANAAEDFKSHVAR